MSFIFLDLSAAFNSLDSVKCFLCLSLKIYHPGPVSPFLITVLSSSMPPPFCHCLFTQRLSLAHWLWPMHCSSVGLNYVCRWIWPAVSSHIHTVITWELAHGGIDSFQLDWLWVNFWHRHYPPDIQVSKTDCQPSCTESACGWTWANWDLKDSAYHWSQEQEAHQHVMPQGLHLVFEPDQQVFWKVSPSQTPIHPLHSNLNPLKSRYWRAQSHEKVD